LTISLLNSTAPLFGAVFSALWLAERLTLRKLAGLILGTAGVALVSSMDNFERTPMGFLAVAACLLAPACYALAGIYVKKRASAVKPMAIAGGSQLAAGLVLLPLVFFFPPSQPVTLEVGALTAAFALFCSAVAYLIYYRLIADVGPTRALTVTFLIPVFAMIWGALFLAESITVARIVGAVVILGGTALIAVPGPQRTSDGR
jgi:drug/metabolite transporter (DMT)-like permease